MGEYKIYNETTENYEKELIYFKKRHEKAKVFCSRFPNGINFRKKIVLDIGCGHGALSFHALDEGAKYVVGIDINEKVINFANTILRRDYYKYKDKAKFIPSDINDLDFSKFDIIISHTAFEHIIDPQRCLNGIEKRLNKKGEVYIGFTGLYNSPWGDHRRTQVPFQKFFPWAHLCFNKQWIIKNYNSKFPSKPISSIHDLGLNGLSFSQYESIFKTSKLKNSYFKVNVAQNPLVLLLSVFRLIPFLRELLSFNIYTVLKNY